MTIGIGALLGDRWELTRRLASGGMGDVYRAGDRDGGPDVAVKVLRGGVKRGEIRFASEIDLLTRLSHPNIVGVLGAGEYEDRPYMVMELLPGRTLADVLVGGQLPLAQVRSIGAGIAAALAHAHSYGIINRDVKPGNILFGHDDTAKLADFGIAKLQDAATITTSGTAMGTASYIAPEQLSDREAVGPHSDVYSLGLVLLEAATGRRAFQGTSAEIALARLAQDPRIPDELPEPWQRLLAVMTARDPALRPSAERVEELLAADLPEEAVAALPVPVPAEAMAAGAAGGQAAAGTPVDREVGGPNPEVEGARALEVGPATEPVPAGGWDPRTAAAGGADAAEPVSDGSTDETGQRTAGRGRGRPPVLVAALLLLLVLAAFAFLSGGDDRNEQDEPDSSQQDPADSDPEQSPEAEDGQGPEDGGATDPPADEGDEPAGGDDGGSGDGSEGDAGDLPEGSRGPPGQSGPDPGSGGPPGGPPGRN